MTCRKLSIATAAVVALIALSVVPSARAWQATPAPSATPGAVTQRPVEFPDGELISLSPDGRWLVARRAIDDGRELCVLDAASLAQLRCASAELSSVEWTAAVWSPDGTRLAFTEDWPIRLDESDLWVFDAAEGTLANLTDDQSAEKGVLSPVDAPLDVVPAWSPDGQELAFIRIQPDGDDEVTVGLFRIPADGGEPRLVATIGDDPVAITDGVRWAPDGRSILYSTWPLSGNGGIWSVPAAGGRPSEVLTGVPGIPSGVPVLVDLDARGQALVSLPNVVPEPGVPRFAVVDLTIGSAVLLGADTAEGAAVAVVRSPAGTRVALVYERPDGSQFLAVRDLAAGGEQVVAELDVGLERMGALTGYGLTWASNGVLFHRGSGQTGLLLYVAAA